MNHARCCTIMVCVLLTITLAIFPQGTLPHDFGVPASHGSSTFGVTNTGSNTTYPTTTTTVGDTTTFDGIYDKILAVKFTAAEDGLVTSLGMNIYDISYTDYVVFGIYSDSSNYPGNKLGQATQIYVSAHYQGWKYGNLQVPIFIQSGTQYWFVLEANTYCYPYLKGVTNSAYYYAASYTSTLPSTYPISGTVFDEQFNMRYIYAKIGGYVKATKAALSEAATSVTSMSFYSHATGNFYAAIYTDSGGPAVLKWTSGSTAALATAWTTILISAGTPNTLSLAAGDYWLAWQWDSVNAGPSYALSGANTGAYLAQAYGAFQDPMTGETLSTENWSIYVTYTAAQSHSKTPSDSISQLDSLGRNFVGARVNPDSAVVTDLVVKLRNVPDVLSETMAWQGTLAWSWSGSRLLSDQLGLADELKWVSPKYVFPSDAIQLSESLGAQYGYVKSFIEQILVTDTLSSRFIGARALLNTLTLADPFSFKFVGAKILSDISSTTDNLARNYVGARATSDLLSIVDSVTRQRAVPKTITDILRITMSLTHVGPPAAPTSVSATQNPVIPQSAIDLTWTESDTYSGMTYYVDKSTDQITWLSAGSSSTTSFTASGLAPGYGYYFRIRAYNGQYSAYSSTVLGVTGPSSTGPGGGGNPPTILSYMLVIKIVDLNGTPVQGASVTVGSWSLLSDSIGIANFGTPQEGTYVIRISASTCQTANQTISLNSDHNLINPLQVSLTCGTQQATTTGTPYTTSQIEQLAEGILGISLLAIAVFALIQTRKKKARKRKETT